MTRTIVKLISGLLVICLMFSAAPMAAFANVDFSFLSNPIEHSTDPGFVLVPYEQEGNTLKVGLVLQNCVGLKYGSTVIEFDNNILSYSNTEAGKDTIELNNNSANNYVNFECNCGYYSWHELTLDFYFEDLLRSYEGTNINVCADYFEIAVFTFIVEQYGFFDTELKFRSFSSNISVSGATLELQVSNAEGFCSEDNNVRWSMDKNGKVIISGKGVINENEPFYMNKDITELVIQSGITEICYNAFYGCVNMKNVEIAEGLKIIRGQAFCGCESINSITIPKSVEVIDFGAFRDCVKLINITFPDSTIYIGSQAFDNTAWYNTLPEGIVYAGKTLYSCKGTVSDQIIDILQGTTGIANGAFMARKNIKAVNFPDSLIYIGDSCFKACEGLSTISIPNSIKSIGNGAFMGCNNLTSISLPDYLQVIEATCFYGSGINQIKIPHRVTYIDSWAFYGCKNLNTVIIPKAIEEIGFNAFSECENIKDVYYEGTKEQWNMINIEGNNDYLENANIHFNYEYELPEHYHIWDNGEIITPPTCISFGEMLFTCVLCGETKTAIIEELTEHKWNEGEVTSEPTCKKEGIKTFTCITCGETKTEEIDRLITHTWNDGEIISPATCEDEGEKIYTCVICGETKKESIPAAGHDWGAWSKLDGEQHQRVCKTDASHTETAVHSWDGGEITKPATVTEEGEKTFTCTVCGNTKTEPIPKQTGEQTIDTDQAKEIGDTVYAAPGLTVNELLAAAGNGAVLKDSEDKTVPSNAVLSSGMVLTKADGAQKTIVVKGDNDGDGAVTAADARFTLRVAVGLEAPNEWQQNACLVAGGTAVTAADARLILRAAVGLEELDLS